MTVSTILTTLAAVAEHSLTPSPRGAAIAATLRELAAEPGVTGLIVGKDALRAALVVLAAPRPSDDGPTTSRRATCRDLAALLGGGDPSADTDALIGEALPLWAAWAEIAASASDPRRLTMRTTYRREWGDLLAASSRQHATMAEVVDWSFRAGSVLGPSTNVHVETSDFICSRYVQYTLRETYSDGVATVARVLTDRGAYRFPRPVLVAAGAGMHDPRRPLHFRVLVDALHESGLKTNDPRNGGEVHDA